MNVFVSEYVCSGAWPEAQIKTSLYREGRAMLLAFLDDLTKVSECRAVTTWDHRLGPFPSHLDRVHAVVASSNDDERRLFEELAASADAALAIAPEFDKLLLDRTRRLETLPCQCLGPTADAVRLCADKLSLAAHLQHNDVPTVKTMAFDPRSAHPEIDLPLVLKPRDGAGSQLTFLIDSSLRFQAARDRLQAAALPAVQQPYLAGQCASVGILVHSTGRIETLRPGEQSLSNDGRFRYLGGVIPGRFAADVQIQIEATARSACVCIPGLRGYVGLDLIVPTAQPCNPLVVDINPRLTTSYLGYRSLTEDNLAARIAYTRDDWPAINWLQQRIVFSAVGSCQSGPRCEMR